ncbi:MAG: winged helix-turn-helix domain-containing protein [Clostridiales bacterium]|nr:winged helix-turn-helix domain-containing protein [Clostridiales bacterium]
MAIPKYDELYRDFLDALADGETHSLSEIRKRISIARNMPAEDLQQLLPSGKKTVFADRVGWAGTYLHKAGLISRVSRGKYEITLEGKKLQQSADVLIDNN